MHRRNCICGADCDWNRFMALPGREGRERRSRARLNLREPHASTECTLEPSRECVCGRDVKYCFIAPRHTKHLAVLAQLITIKKWSRARLQSSGNETPALRRRFVFRQRGMGLRARRFSLCGCLSLSGSLFEMNWKRRICTRRALVRARGFYHSYIYYSRAYYKCEMPRLVLRGLKRTWSFIKKFLYGALAELKVDIHPT
jgi:hypothetical protein